MKIALIGYGNMGQEIEKVVNEGTKHQISSISSDSRGFDEDGIKNADVVIDFSSPEPRVAPSRPSLKTLFSDSLRSSRRLRDKK